MESERKEVLGRATKKADGDGVAHYLCGSEGETWINKQSLMHVPKWAEDSLTQYTCHQSYPKLLINSNFHIIDFTKPSLPT